MSPLIIRQNVSVPDPMSYFSSLWSLHSDSLTASWLTDLRLVAGQQKEVVVWVHRAVLLPLCPLLAVLVEEADSEGEPLVFLPDFPLELVQSFVKLIYQGCCPLTQVTNVEALLKLLEAVGFDKSRLFNMNSDGLQLKVTVEAVGSVGDSSNETHEVEKKSFQKLISYCDNPQEDSNMSRKLNNNSNEEMSKQAKLTVVKEITTSIEIIEDLVKDTIAPTKVIEEIATEEKIPDSLAKKARRKSTDVKYSCQFCDFKCRFFLQLVNHSNTSHSGSNFNCDQCSYQGTKIVGLKMHMKRVHEGNVLGDFECDVCEFKVDNNKKLTIHKKLQHSTENEKLHQNQPISSQTGVVSTNPKDLTNIKKPSKPFNADAEVKYTCFRCPFHTMYKHSLLRHVTTYHKVNLGK